MAAGLLAIAGSQISTVKQLAQAARGLDARFDEAPRRHEFELTAQEFDWEVSPGTVVRAWGYNGQVPGPELRVREGDEVRIRLRNELSVPTTIHWHGINLRPEMDGVAGLNQAAVDPGAEFSYEFTATPAGSRWYHSHTDPALQMAMGLYGLLIVEPRQPIRTHDREYTYILGEWDLELTPEVAAGRAPRGPRDQMLRGGELGADLFLMNGRTHDLIPPMVVTEGERVLIRLINAGHLPHTFHTHGHSFRIIATDGNPVPAGMEWTKDTLLIGPAERYDLELVCDNPGVWMVHCHMEHHMANGMMTVLQYEGHLPTGPAAVFGSPAAASHHEHPTSGTPTGQPPITPNAPAASGAVVINLVDDRIDPPVVTVPRDTTVTWINRGADWHSLAAFDGSFESDRIAPGETFAHRFTQPGSVQYICKHHALQGMMGRIDVT
ncbi:MAG: multicopper oxidase domain-containing protein [Chloroflexota bacterium]|nr:multicopper oxidase domain-containing protein [Chloroflexota bacterium]